MSAIPEVDSFEVGFSDRLHALARKPLLDVHVVDHCNLRCRGCVHFAPLARERSLDLGDYEADLSELATIPDIEGYFHGLYLMGGKPLLHPRITDVMSLTRQMLPGMRVLLVTNGILLRRMGDEFWDALVARCPSKYVRASRSARSLASRSRASFSRLRASSYSLSALARSSASLRPSSAFSAMLLV